MLRNYEDISFDPKNDEHAEDLCNEILNVTTAFCLDKQLQL